MLTVTTANVNGIRAASKKGFTEWLTATRADIVCLQEVRAEPHEFPPGLHEPEGWHTLVAPAAAAAKGRAGVALYSRVEPLEKRIGFGSEEFDASGRYAEMVLPNITIASLYLPSGEAGTPRQDEKYRFMREFMAHLADLKKRAETDGREVLVCGDWNIAHREIDLKNWKTNQKAAGFLPEERAWFTDVIDKTGYVDVTRTLHEGPGPYTWWSFRGQAFANDSGWRIDYQMATPGLAGRVLTSVVERALTYEERWSDHAPVTCVYDWIVPGYDDATIPSQGEGADSPVQ